MHVTNVYICFGSKYYSSQQMLENIILKKAGESYGCLQSHNFRSANILAYWVGNDGIIHDLNKFDLTPRPGEVKFFLQQIVYKINEAFTFILAKVLWLLPVSPQLMKHFGKPVQVWGYQVS